MEEGRRSLRNAYFCLICILLENLLLLQKTPSRTYLSAVKLLLEATEKLNFWKPRLQLGMPSQTDSATLTAGSKCKCKQDWGGEVASRCHFRWNLPTRPFVARTTLKTVRSSKDTFLSKLPKRSWCHWIYICKRNTHVLRTFAGTTRDCGALIYLWWAYSKMERFLVVTGHGSGTLLQLSQQ